MIKDFKKFIFRGNVVDLAVAVVIGAAFGAVVSSLVKDVFTPLVAAIIGQPNFSGLVLTINGSQILYGQFLNALITFLSIAATIFFFVIQPINKMTKLANRRKAPLEPDFQQCQECLSEIPKAARRCKFCTSSVKSPD